MEDKRCDVTDLRGRTLESVVVLNHEVVLRQKNSCGDLERKWPSANMGSEVYSRASSQFR